MESDKTLAPARPPGEIVSLAERRTLRADQNKGTLREACDLYVASLALEALKKPSRSTYRQAMREAIAALPERPSKSDVRLWLEGLARERSPSTANKLGRVMKAVTERATLVQRGGGWELRNAFKAFRPLKTAARERRDASPATVRRLLELVADSAETLAVRLAAFYGLRSGELSGLQPGDVRTDYGRTRITVVRTRDGHGPRDRKNAMNGKPHVVSIEGDSATESLVTTLLDVRARLSLVDGRSRGLAEEWLLPWGHGHPAALMNRWRQDSEVALPKGDAWHALRHYGATTLAANGATVTELQAWLGDSTATAAMTYMGQVRGTTQGTARRVLAEFNAATAARGGPPENEAPRATHGGASPLHARDPRLGLSSHLDVTLSSHPDLEKTDA